jgi:putative spermidine/putrescine transport system permease protein
VSRVDLVRAGLMLWLGGVLVFLVSPLVFVVINSFNASAVSEFPPTGFSLRWYADALSYGPFGTGLRQSLIVGLSSAAVAMFTGTLASIALVRYKFKGRSLMQAVFVAPFAMPKVALGLAGLILFLRLGDLFNAQELMVGTPIDLVMMHALVATPLVVVIVSAGLLGVERSVEEAAEDLGASPRQTLMRVTLPLILPALVIAAVFAFNQSFDEVEMALFLSPLFGQTLPVEMYLYMVRAQDPTMAAVSTLILGVSFTVVIVLAWRFGAQRVIQASQRRG